MKEEKRRKIEGSSKESRRLTKKETEGERKSRWYATKDRQGIKTESRTQEKKETEKNRLKWRNICFI